MLELFLEEKKTWGVKGKLFKKQLIAKKTNEKL
jgi:hypothetical protein